MAGNAQIGGNPDGARDRRAGAGPALLLGVGLALSTCSATEAAPCAYLELTETNTDTFDSIEILHRKAERPQPFVFADGILTVDAALMAEARRAAPEADIARYVHVTLAEGQEGGVYVLHRIAYTGMAREDESSEYYAVGALPLAIEAPAAPPADTAEVTLGPWQTADFAMGLRLWPGELRILAVDDEGNVEIAIGPQEMTVPPGETRALGRLERTFHIREWADGFETIDLGEAEFRTELSFRNHGCPSEIRRGGGD